MNSGHCNALGMAVQKDACAVKDAMGCSMPPQGVAAGDSPSVSSV